MASKPGGKTPPKGGTTPPDGNPPTVGGSTNAMETPTFGKGSNQELQLQVPPGFPAPAILDATAKTTTSQTASASTTSKKESKSSETQTSSSATDSSSQLRNTSTTSPLSPPRTSNSTTSRLNNLEYSREFPSMNMKIESSKLSLVDIFRISEQMSEEDRINLISEFMRYKRLEQQRDTPTTSSNRTYASASNFAIPEPRFPTSVLENPQPVQSESNQLPSTSNVRPVTSNPRQFASNFQRLIEIKRKNNMHLNGNKPKFVAKCNYCTLSGHFPDRCFQFRTLEQRAQKAESKNLCEKCLGKHDSLLCNSRIPCYYCKENERGIDFSHHGSLCPFENWQ